MWLYLSFFSKNGFLFVSSLVWANLAPKELFGKYTFLLSTLSLAAIFSLSKMTSSLSISSARDLCGNARILLKRRIKLSFLLGGVFFLCLSTFYFLKGDKSFSQLFFVLLFVFPFWDFQNYWMQWWEGKKEFKKIFINQFSISLLTFLCVLFVVFKKREALLPLIFILPSIFSTLFVYRITRCLENNETDDSIDKYGFHLSYVDLFALINNLERPVIGHFISFEVLAEFSVASVFPKLMLNMLNVYKRTFLPDLYKMNCYRDSLPIVWKRFKALVPLVFACILLQILFLQQVITFFWGNTYSNVILLVHILLVAEYLSIPHIMYSSILIAQKNLKFLYFGGTFLPCLRLVLWFFLLPKYGVIGMAVTQVIYRCALLVIVMLFILKSVNNEKRNKLCIK